MSDSKMDECIVIDDGPSKSGKTVVRPGNQKRNVLDLRGVSPMLKRPSPVKNPQRSEKRRKMCGQTVTVNGVRFICVDEDCDKHKVPSKPRGVLKSTTEIICLSSSDEETEVDETPKPQHNKDPAAPQQNGNGIVEQIKKKKVPTDTDDTVTPVAEVKSDDKDISKQYPVMGQLLADVVTPTHPTIIVQHHMSKPVTDTSPSSVGKPVNKPATDTSSTTVSKPVSKPVTISPTARKFVSILPTVIEPIVNGDAHPMNMMNGNVDRPIQSTPRKSNLPTNRLNGSFIEPEEHCDNGLDETVAYGRRVNGSTETISYSFNEDNHELSDKVKVDQIRDSTKLSRKIVAKYYKILLKQPFVVLEYIVDENSEEEIKNIPDPKTCPWCEKKFVFEKSLVYHVNMYHKHGAMPFACRECGKEFMKQTGLNHHIQSQHITQPMEECPHCRKLFVKAFIESHIKRKHLSQGVQCSVCGAKFQSRSDLPYHMKLAHPQSAKTKGQGNYVRGFNTMARCVKCSSVLPPSRICKMCDSRIMQNTPSSPTGPSEDVLPALTLACPTCHKSFLGVESRDRHYRKYHDESTMPFICSHCNAGYLCKETLDNHIYYIHQRIKNHVDKSITDILREKFKYSTMDCQSLLQKLLRMQKNGQTMTIDDNKVVCPICLVHCANQRARDEHFRTVHGEEYMPYHCDICSRGYFQPNVLLKHYRLNHTDVFAELAKAIETVPESGELQLTVPSLNKSGYLKCPVCAKPFAEYSKRDLHYRRMHNEEDMPFKCSKCNRGYLAEESLKKHKTSLCNFKQSIAAIDNEGEVLDIDGDIVSLREPSSTDSTVQRVGKPTCSICAKTFLTEHGLDWHMKEKHQIDGKDIILEID